MPKLLLALVSTAGFLAACGESPADPGTEPPPATVESVAVEGAPPELRPGDRVQLTARALDAEGEPVAGRAFSWESDDLTVATVNADGMVTAVAGGEVTIYATTELVTGGLFLTVTDDEAPAVAWIDVDPAGEVELATGATLQLGATAYSADGEVLEGRALTWSSSDTAAATVSSSGVVTAVAAGYAWIAVECEDARDEMLVRVPDIVEPPTPVDHVTLDYVEIVLPVGETTLLVAQPRDAQGEPLARPVTWSSNNPAYVSVDASGLVTALDVGGADITATSEGQSASVRVYATYTTDYTLVGLDGGALPAMLGTYTETLPDGSTSTRGIRIHDGWLTIDHNSQTYEATIRGVYTTATQTYWVPIPITYHSFGAVEQTPAGDLVFSPNVGDPFTGRWVATGLELAWQLDGRISGASTFLFATD